MYISVEVVTKVETYLLVTRGHLDEQRVVL